MSRSRWAMALTYLFYVFFPHCASVTHSHAGGGVGHTHAFLSAHDADLEKTALAAFGYMDAANYTQSGQSLAPITATASPFASTVSVEPGSQAIKTAGPALHTHFQEDPNLLSVASAFLFFFLLLSIRRIPGTSLVPIPLRAALYPSARGPPFLLPA